MLPACARNSCGDCKNYFFTSFRTSSGSRSNISSSFPCLHLREARARVGKGCLNFHSLPFNQFARAPVPPTREQEKQARLPFQQPMEEATGRISGTANGTTDVSTEQKNAVIKLLITFPFSD
jgi:hypothetical protein